MMAMMEEFNKFIMIKWSGDSESERGSCESKLGLTCTSTRHPISFTLGSTLAVTHSPFKG
jgi:hypothetical protein